MLELHPTHIATSNGGSSNHYSLANTIVGRSSLLSVDDRAALAETALSARSVKAGVDLAREGGATDCLYFLIDGWACRYKLMRDGSRQLPALLVPGDICNLDSLMLDRLNYGVRTITAGTVLVLARDRALKLCAEHVGIGQTFTRLALVENAILSQWALCLGRQSAKQRAAHLLCELSVRLGNDRDDADASFEVPLVQEQLADALGLTAVHVNRTLQALRAEDLFTKDGRIVTLPDVSRLRELAEFNPAYLHHSREEAANVKNDGQ